MTGAWQTARMDGFRRRRGFMSTFSSDLLNPQIHKPPRGRLSCLRFRPTAHTVLTPPGEARRTCSAKPCREGACPVTTSWRPVVRMIGRKRAGTRGGVSRLRAHGRSSATCRKMGRSMWRMYRRPTIRAWSASSLPRPLGGLERAQVHGRRRCGNLQPYHVLRPGPDARVSGHVRAARL